MIEKDEVVLKVENLKKFFPIKQGMLQRTTGHVKAVDDISFYVKKGETLALVGESGCGKTTAARCVLRALSPTSGAIHFLTEEKELVDITSFSLKQMKPLRRQMQMIFQDPFASLNPRMTIYDILNEPLMIHGEKNVQVRNERIAELLELVGLRPEYMKRYPHVFSGGQRQRVGIARALALNPSLVVADEPVSALDVSVQAQILNLLVELQRKINLSYLFIAHNLSVVRHISDRVAVMYVGKIVEVATTLELFSKPLHPYTEALLSAVPKPDPLIQSERIVLSGDVEDPANPPSGCYFHTRCRYAVEKCRVEMPELEEMVPNHHVMCHRAAELKLKGIDS